jgi:hypothetical protein
MQHLSDPLNLWDSSEADDVSADGSIIVGGGTPAFIWDAKNGMQSLQEVLEHDFCLDLSGWLSLSRAAGVSDDGLTIVGDGSGPGGSSEGWIAKITPLNETDVDDDGTPNCADGCPTDPNKIELGECGCHVPDDDTDTDGVLDCFDNCPDHDNPGQEDCDQDGMGDVCAIAAGVSQDCNGNSIPDGCDVDSSYSQDCNDNIVPDECEPDCNDNNVPDGCDIDPADPDGNGEVSDDCQPNNIPDECDITNDTSEDCNTNDIPDECEPDCNANDIADSCDITSNVSADCDLDGVPDECEANDDGDHVINDCDSCPDTPPGVLVDDTGCPLPFGPCCFSTGTCIDDRDADECMAVDGDYLGDGLICGDDPDGDGAFGCDDGCPLDLDKTIPGICGCGAPDDDSDGDGVADCNDNCALANPDQADCQPNGTGDVCDIESGTSADCDFDAVPDECELDSDFDSVIDDCDGCPNDINKTAPGECGCGVPDAHSDEDGVPDCHDGCPLDSEKTEPGTCGCGVPEEDTDGDGIGSCIDACPDTPADTAVNECGCLIIGACCFEAGFCWDALDPVTCREITGVYQGDGSICNEGCGFGDFDEDGDVDLRDFAYFQGCFTGAGGGPIVTACQRGDIDRCGAIDSADHVALHHGWTGPGS